VAPKLRAEDLIGAVPGLAEAASVRASTFRRLPGADLQLADVVALAREIEAVLHDDVDGVVVTQGTDTIEEVAFGLDVLLDVPQPVVVTGAMRNPQLAGADGPANVLAAVRAAAAQALRGLGCVVAMGDEIHAARLAVKSHTSRPDAITSPLAGPVGWIAENRVRVALRPPRPALDLPHDLHPRRVALVTVGLGDDGALISAAAEAGFEGIVIEALGGGHVPAAMVDPIEEAAAEMPVLLASRTQAGETLRETYGFPGSERDLLARGVLSAGWLGGRKARVLLALLLDSKGPDGVAAALEGYLETGA